MDKDAFDKLPSSAFTRGITRLGKSGYTSGVVVLGFDCEYDSETQEIVCYQLSDGVTSELLEATEDLTLPMLAEWAIMFARKVGNDMRHVSTVLLVSHYTAAELSHVKQFWVEGEVRRVSPQQVFNVTYRVNRRLRVVVYDLFHFFNTSLAKVAKTFGLKKLDYDTTQVSRASLRDPRFREYAVVDAELCALIFKAFRERVRKDYGLDVVRYCTPASLAMAVYRKHWLKADLPAPAKRVRRMAWRCLWGGRSEAFVAGDYNHVGYTLRDVVSLYPRSAELVGLLPTKDSWVRLDEPRSWRGLCVVRFRYPAGERFPGLPVIAAGRLVFPLSGTSWCTLSEAKAARDAGAVLSFKSVYEYTGGDGTLAAYMKEYTRLKAEARETGDSVGGELYKLLMNALIGKLSQHKGDVDIEDAKKAAEQLGVPLEVVLDPAFHHPLKPTATPRVGGNVMPEWSALILGEARAVMGRLIRLEGLEPKVTSTDSLLIPSKNNYLVDAAMVGLGVVLTDKNANPVKEGKRVWCEACPDPAPVNRVRVLRTRVYAGLCPHGKAVWSATHALHLPKRDDVAANFLMGSEDTYMKRSRLGLKTAVRQGRRFQEESRLRMSFRRGWDEKRRLLPSGETLPWPNAQAAIDRMEKG